MPKPPSKHEKVTFVRIGDHRPNYFPRPGRDASPPPAGAGEGEASPAKRHPTAKESELEQTLISERAKFEANIRLLQQDKERAEVRRGELQSQVDQLQRRVDGMGPQGGSVSAGDSNSESLKRELTKMTTVVTELRAELGEERSKRREAESRSTGGQDSSIHQVQIEELRIQVAREREVAQAERAKVEAEADAKREALDRVTESKREINQLTLKLEDSHTSVVKLQGLERQITDLTEQLARAKEDLAAETKRRKTAEEDTSRSTSQVTIQLTELRSNLASERRNWDNERALLESRAKDAEARRDQLDRELREALSAASFAKDETVILKGNYNDLQGTNSDLAAQLTDLRRELEQEAQWRREAEEALRQAGERYARDLEASRMDNDSERKRLGELTEEVERLRRELASAEARLAGINEGHEREVNEMQATLEEYRQLEANLQAQFDAARRELEEEMQAIRDEASRTTSDLRSQLDRLNRELNDALSLIDRLKQECADATSALRRLEDTNDELESQLRQTADREVEREVTVEREGMRARSDLLRRVYGNHKAVSDALRILKQTQKSDAYLRLKNGTRESHPRDIVANTDTCVDSLANTINTSAYVIRTYFTNAEKLTNGLSSEWFKSSTGKPRSIDEKVTTTVTKTTRPVSPNSSSSSPPHPYANQPSPQAYNGPYSPSAVLSTEKGANASPTAPAASWNLAAAAAPKRALSPPRRVPGVQ